MKQNGNKMTGSPMLAKLVHVRVKEGKTGLFYATSPELKGMLVAEPTLDALEKSIPNAIADLYRACGVDVFVSKIEDQSGDLRPWVAFPASIAKAALSASHAVN